MNGKRLGLEARIVVTAFLLLLFCGCALFDIFSTGPEFSVSGARVAVLPFAGPGTWYGQSSIARTILRHTLAILRRGGAEVCYDKTINAELIDYSGAGSPPWVLYGKRLKADYVIVGRLESWEVGSPKAVGYCPGSARLHLQIYDVAEEKICYERNDISGNVSNSYMSTSFPSNSSETKETLIQKIHQKIRRLFVGRSNQLE